MSAAVPPATSAVTAALPVTAPSAAPCSAGSSACWANAPDDLPSTNGEANAAARLSAASRRRPVAAILLTAPCSGGASAATLAAALRTAGVQELRRYGSDAGPKGLKNTGFLHGRGERSGV